MRKLEEPKTTIVNSALDAFFSSVDEGIDTGLVVWRFVGTLVNVGNTVDDAVNLVRTDTDFVV